MDVVAELVRVLVWPALVAAAVWRGAGLYVAERRKDRSAWIAMKRIEHAKDDRERSAAAADFAEPIQEDGPPLGRTDSDEAAIERDARSKR